MTCLTCGSHNLKTETTLFRHSRSPDYEGRVLKTFKYMGRKAQICVGKDWLECQDCSSIYPPGFLISAPLDQTNGDAGRNTAEPRGG